MPEQKVQLEKNGLSKTKSFMSDHKGVQIAELNFKGEIEMILLQIISQEWKTQNIQFELIIRFPSPVIYCMRRTLD